MTTDKELSQFGEKLYEAILMTPLPGGTIFAIASAIRHGTPWKALPGSLKLAVFKIAANCLPEDPSPTPPSGSEPTVAVGVAAGAVDEGATPGEEPNAAAPDAIRASRGAEGPVPSASLDASSKLRLEEGKQDADDQPTPEAA